MMPSEQIFQQLRLDAGAIYEQYRAYAERLRPHVCGTTDMHKITGAVCVYLLGRHCLDCLSGSFRCWRCVSN